MDRRGHPRSEDDTPAKRTRLLLLGYVASFVVALGGFAFVLFQFLHLIDFTGSDRAAPFMTLALPVLLSLVGFGTLYKLRGFTAKLKAERSSGAALRTLSAAQHNVRGSIPAPPGQFEKTLQVLARRGVKVKLLVGDEASSRVLVNVPNVEVRLTDWKTGFLIVDDAATISGPGTELGKEDGAHVYIDTPATPEASEKLQQVIKAFDNAFDLAPTPTGGDTQPDTH